MKKHVKKFNRELRRSIHTAIVAAFGFLIALVWRDLIVEYVDQAISISPIKGKLITAIVITIFSVIGIFILTRITRVKK